ncbi:tryptophan-rich sensory protein [Marasmitruncus massiliensis]|uniref:tryptophan-rich sensory protein n=1 Tax=Marasmitruncus massiliensis TaxID=1944642 RepID=UPI000C79777F|nr:tryptophan-rich sensory protein [Marasmitruncus massiliensis]
MKSMKTCIKISVIVTFMAMVLVSVLAETLPVNGMTTGQVSNLYPNLFVPADYTFSIWPVIYLLLAGYALYQFGFFRKKSENPHAMLRHEVGVYFCVSSLVNICWVLVWHYQMIALSLILIVILLACLAEIVQAISKENLTPKETMFLKLPFDIYTGWISIAAIANITVYLVSLEWDHFRTIESAWTIIVLLTGLVAGLRAILKYDHIAFGMIVIWAYLGILVKHLSKDGFSGSYPRIIGVVAVSLILLFAAAVRALMDKRKKRCKT